MLAASTDEADATFSSSPPLPDVMPSTPLDTMPRDFRTALDDFRNNWQRELEGQHNSEHDAVEAEANEAQDTLSALPTEDVNPLAITTKPEAEQQMLAESLFREAVELEQRGKVYDALPFYRKAVQIVPDIEFRFYERQKLKLPTLTTGGGKVAEAVEILVNDDDEEALIEEELPENLYEKFQMDLARDCGGRLLMSSRDAGVISTELHISDLPPELLFSILRWVVSAQLDMRSLEQCAAVCKGLYLCARDEDLWRSACVKVWGVNVGTLNRIPAQENTIMIPDSPLPCSYTSWRQMFIERERVLFNGCYISKTTYLRMGENSFQDQYYRPVQLVEYYRYLRFLPDGTVLMITSADEPPQGVPKLKHVQQVRPDVLRGHYRLYGSTVTIVLRKPQQHLSAQRFIPTATGGGQRQRRGSVAEEVANSTKYCIEMRIMNTPKRNFAQLVWVNYSIVQQRNKVETSSEFDLTPSKYPPLWFSPVRSYHLDADAPLA